MRFNIGIIVAVVVTLTSTALVWMTDAQLISLRHPETSQASSNNDNRPHLFRRPMSAVLSQQLSRVPSQSTPLRPLRRHTAKPGNVIVHFDRNHEISQLDYVLSDGRLATLFERRQNGTTQNTVRSSQATGSELPATEKSTVTVESTKAPISNNNGASNDETIDILDAKMRGVAQLIGDEHVTIELPPLNDKLSVLATVANDSFPNGVPMASFGASNKLRPIASLLLDKLKAKVGAKLGDLPAIIQQKLRRKSSLFGQILVEGSAPSDAANNYVNPTKLGPPIVVPAPPLMQPTFVQQDTAQVKSFADESVQQTDDLNQPPQQQQIEQIEQSRRRSL